MDSFDSNSGSRGNGSRPSDREVLRLEPADADGDAEARMRQALGLFGSRPAPSDSTGGARPSGGGHMQVGARRHRFVQDGEVPVSVVRGRRDSVASGSSSAPRVSDERERLVEESLAEKAGREHAERRLAEAQITIKALQTRLGHAELERDEVVSELKRLRDQLSAAERADSERARATEMRRERPSLKMSDEGGVLSEPEPVKWWL